MPGDLNLKKSWHPGLVKNQEKVWQREQDALKEHQRIKERQRELEEERERHALVRLQYGDDLAGLPASKRLELSKLDWMYTEGPQKNDSGFTELGEYVEGKQRVEDMLSGKQVVGGSSKSTSRLDRVIGAHLALARDVLAAALAKDDPLAKIRGQMAGRVQKEGRDRRHPRDRPSEGCDRRDQREGRDRRDQREGRERDQRDRRDRRAGRDCGVPQRGHTPEDARRIEY